MGLSQAQYDVGGLLRSGTGFDAIEDRIEEIPDLDDQERSALWLYAWSHQGRMWQRSTASRLLHRVGSS
jgi:hypothetical protein